MKDKLLCALKNNILYSKKNDNSNYYLVTKDVIIDLYKENEYSETIIITYHKKWWGKEYEEETIKKTLIGYKYYIEAYNKKHEITEKEYHDVLEHRKKELERKKEETIINLCNNAESIKNK